MEPLDPKLRQLIDEGLPAAMPDAEAQGRGLAALLAEIDAPPPVPPAAAPATAGLTKLVLVVAAAGAIGTAGWVATRPDPVPQPAPTVVRAEPAKEAPTPQPAPPPASPEPTPTPEPVSAVVPQPEPPAPPRRPKPRTEPEPSPADALRAEAELIARAESALDRDKPREALALCDMHRDGFDAPQLTTERKAIAASAACMIDPVDTKAARAFIAAHPRSALANKVRQHCGLEKTSTQ